jgi:hypothetical protein
MTLLKVAALLRTNSYIAILNLYGNDFGAEGAEALADALSTSPSITTLELGDNDIEDKGEKALTTVLEDNYTSTTNGEIRVLLRHARGNTKEEFGVGERKPICGADRNDTVLHQCAKPSFSGVKDLGSTVDQSSDSRMQSQHYS